MVVIDGIRTVSAGLERPNTKKCFTSDRRHADAINHCANERRGAFSRQIDRRITYIGKWIQVEITPQSISLYSITGLQFQDSESIYSI